MNTTLPLTLSTIMIWGFLGPMGCSPDRVVEPPKKSPTISVLKAKVGTIEKMENTDLKYFVIAPNGDAARVEIYPPYKSELNPYDTILAWRQEYIDYCIQVPDHEETCLKHNVIKERVIAGRKVVIWSNTDPNYLTMGDEEGNSFAFTTSTGEIGSFFMVGKLDSLQEAIEPFITDYERISQ